MPRLKKAKAIYKMEPKARKSARAKRQKYLKHKHPGMKHLWE